MICKTISLYDDRDDVTLTTYILDDSVELGNGKKRGAVLVCPGGAYLYCSDREGEPVAMAFAAMGYNAFVLRYSVYNENKGDNTVENIIPDLSLPWVEKNSRHPQPMRDLAKALQYIAGHADEWHIDKDKIALCGFSAGAHNAAMYSVYYDKPVISEYLAVDKGVKPVAVVLGYMLCDYRELIRKPEEDNVIFNCMMKAFSGGIENTDEEIAASLSPNLHVSKSTPPMFLWTTAMDDLDSKHSLKMAESLCTHGIPYELHIFEQGEHGLSLSTQATASNSSQIDKDAAKWVELAESWLHKRMAFDLPDESPGF